MNINPEQLYTYKPLSSVRRTPASSDRSVVCTLLIVCAHKGIDECTLRQKNHANRIQTK